MEQTNQTPLVSIQEEIKRKKQLKKRKKIFRVFKIVLIILLFSALIFLSHWYDNSPYSRLQKVKIKNNFVISEQEILEEIDVELNDRIYLMFGPFLENQLEKHPFIEEVTINIDYLSQAMSISVTETDFIGYVVASDIHLLSEDGKTLKTDNMVLITDLPLISGYAMDELELLSNHLSRVDESIYSSISEMKRTPVSYDQQQIRLFMSDGLIVTTPLSGLELLTEEYYFDIVNRLTPENKCILIDPFTQSAVSSPCETSDDSVTNP